MAEASAWPVPPTPLYGEAVPLAECPPLGHTREEGDVQAHMLGLLLWLKDEEFLISVAEWSWDWCMDFPRNVSPLGIEHSLRWTEAHREYRIIFERRAEEYLLLTGLRTENFLSMAVQFLNTNPGAVTSDIFEGLIASEDYLSFFVYMGTVRARREWAERTLCGASDELDWTQLVRRSLMSDLGDMSDIGEPVNHVQVFPVVEELE
mmetsp:Transcript_49311/g.89125  ORF Transcript_49311/g.89125 Transcript_49311/m.89125 type:complete len:206 (-) Transcript_49311:108-725(-)